MHSILQQLFNGSSLAMPVIYFAPPGDEGGNDDGSQNNNGDGAGDTNNGQGDNNGSGQNNSGGSGDQGDKNGSGDRSGKGSLLDRRSKNNEGGDDGNDGADQNNQGNSEGQDGRPEGLPDKFWNAKDGVVNNEALFKAYSDLETAHGKLKREKAIGGEVPENSSDYFQEPLALPDDASNYGKEIAIDDPGLKAWGEVCHKHGIGKDMAHALAKEMFSNMNEFAPTPIDPDQEWTDLGPNAQGVVDGVFTWLEGSAEAGVLSQDDVDIATDLAETAKGVRFLANMRKMAGERAIPAIPPTGGKSMTAGQWNDAFKKAVQAKDYAKQEELSALAEQIFPDGVPQSAITADPEKRVAPSKTT